MSASEIMARRPKNAIVILLDSLNRHARAGASSLRPISTVSRAARFVLTVTTRARCHASGAPRHSLRCDRFFRRKPWGIDLKSGAAADCVSSRGRRRNQSGLGLSTSVRGRRRKSYHTDFTAWDYQRGHESDPWQTRPDPSWIGAPSFARGHTPYDNSRDVSRRDGFSGAAHYRGGDRMARSRAVTIVSCSSSDQFDFARAVRYAGAVRLDVRRRGKVRI